MKSSLAIAVLTSALLAAPAAIVVPTVAIAQAPGCVGDVPAGWLRPGGYCDMLNYNDTITTEPPNAGGAPVDDCPDYFTQLSGHQSEAHLQLVADCESGEHDCDPRPAFEVHTPESARLIFVDHPCSYE